MILTLTVLFVSYSGLDYLTCIMILALTVLNVSYSGLDCLACIMILALTVLHVSYSGPDCPYVYHIRSPVLAESTYPSLKPAGGGPPVWGLLVCLWLGRGQLSI